MTKIKKQHFVPQFYLKNFTDSKHRIYTFDIVDGASFSTSIENIAHQKYFYDNAPLDKFIGVEQAVEKALAGSEGKAAEVLRKLMARLEANDLNSFTKNDYRELADHILTQHKRTPEHRVLTTQLVEKAKALRAKGASDEVIKQLNLEAETYDPQVQQIYGLLSSQVLKDIEGLCDQYWVFWRNKTQHKTSIRPITPLLATSTQMSILKFIFPLHPSLASVFLSRIIFLMPPFGTKRLLSFQILNL